MAKIIKPIDNPAFNQPINAKLLGQAIKARRTQSHLRLEDAAALCGVAKQTLMKIEHGESTSQFGIVLQICSALGIKLQIIPWQDEEVSSNDWQ